MQIRRSVFAFVAIIAILTVLLFWFGKKRAEMPLATSPEINRAVVATSEPIQTNTSARSNNVMPQIAANAPAPPQDKGQQIKEGLNVLNDVPIAFYGRLEDQFGNPVVGAQIATSLRIYNGNQSTVERSSVTSDANGFFQITGGKGEGLGIEPRKQGYVLAATSTYFKYSSMYPDRYTPDQGNPTVIKMWKLQGAEPLVEINREYKILFTNAPMNFDLVTGELVSNGGDLKVIILRAPGSLSQRNRGDWSIELVPVNGGIMEPENSLSVIFEAPQTGYQGNSLVLMNQNDPAWADNIQKTFFLKSRDGKIYSKFSLDFRVNNQPTDSMWFRFRGVANTNGSRNWEASISTQ